jgi:hypothetical protein
MLFALFIVAGLLLGLATGGRVHYLFEREWRGLPLLVLAALVNVFGGFFAWKVAPLAPAIRIVSLLAVYGIVGGVLWRTPGLSRPALTLVTLGGLLNFLVMAANAGQMPVDLDLLQKAGKSPEFVGRIARGQAFRHVALTPGAPLGFLGDTVPLPRPFNVPSPGDLFLAVGLLLLVWNGVRSPAPSGDEAPETIPAVGE